jgi:hypothetical protein
LFQPTTPAQKAKQWKQTIRGTKSKHTTLNGGAETNCSYHAFQGLMSLAEKEILLNHTTKNRIFPKFNTSSEKTKLPHDNTVYLS